MFTGIIERTTPVVSLERTGDTAKLVIATGYDDLALGESIAVNGVCLTVETKDALGNATFSVCAETLSCTHLGRLRMDDFVHLERALKMSDRLSGHWVQGHVDGVAPVVALGANQSFWIEVPAAFVKYCSPKGSITLNGVSLTIHQMRGRQLEIALVPHTIEVTRLGALTVGEPVNFEVDVLAKTVERLLCNTQTSQML